jgi:hypothetical protein
VRRGGWARTACCRRPSWLARSGRPALPAGAEFGCLPAASRQPAVLWCPPAIPYCPQTAQPPGKTQCINHFIINDSWYLVDLPGYG